VIVVDDSASVRQQVGLALGEAGYEVVEAADGSDAIDKIEAQRDIAMVICDINMPRMNGLDVLKRVGKRLPVLMLTTEGQLEMKRQAKELGAKGWIIKPFKADLLIAAVKQLVGS
jgi:two-component system chemotaxis response regulator CheY